MINVLDDFLSEELHESVYNKLKSNEFEVVETPGKNFWVQYSNDEFDKIIIDKLSEIHSNSIQNVLGFFRMSNQEADTDWRIHTDSIINNDRPTHTLVIYISDSQMKGLHGTAFWNHPEFGDKLPEDVSEERYDYMLTNEANNLDLWELTSVVGYKPNRGVIFNADSFHSKYPKVSWESGRMIYVMFYKVGDGEI
jgi:hypothetical protein